MRRRARGSDTRAADTAADTRVVLQAAALLLQYPDERVRAARPAVADAVRALPASTSRERLLAFLQATDALAERELEEHYVAVLDRRRRACLFLTWWTDGETRRRGLSLARLKGLYREHGLELADGELPDFLPVVCEFGAQADVAAALEVLAEYRAGLELLRLALVEEATPYARVVEAVCALLPGPSPRDEAAARALARSGPPEEAVGLEGLGGMPPGGPGAEGPASGGPVWLGELAPYGGNELVGEGRR